MKIALCLHGYFNSQTDKNSLGQLGYEYIKDNILDRFDVDVYIHSWEPNIYQQLVNLYNPVVINSEEQKDFTEIVTNIGLRNLKNPPRAPEIVLSHFYSIQKVFELMYKINKKYDMVIKSRFDLGQINRRTSPHHVECINLIYGDLSRLHMASWPDKWMMREGPPDMWFYANYTVMKTFSIIYDSILQYMNSTSDVFDFVSNILGDHNISNASVLYKHFFENQNLWNNRYQLICSDNMVK